MWDKMNKYYKQCNFSTKNQNNNLNRNDLMHGGYVYNATNKDCLKLIKEIKKVIFLFVQKYNF